METAFNQMIDQEKKLALKAFKHLTKIAADGTLFLNFYLSKEIRLDVSCESFA